MAWQQPGFVVIDPRLAAPRGEAYSVSARQEQQEQLLAEIDDYHLPFRHQPDASLDASVEQASADKPIDQSNVGFKLLQKMGWKGQGLGKNEDGRVEPVAGGVEAGSRLGVGKAEQDDFFTSADNVGRRRLEVEIQADEDEGRQRRREEQAQREARIQEEVTEMKRTFYCELCNKQYNTAMEIENHLSSYDHHHKKRLQEMKAMQNARGRDERQRKEQRQQEKEMQRLHQQFLKAQAGKQQQGQATAAAAGRSSGGGAAAPPPPPPTDAAPPPPPPPPDAAPPPPPPLPSGTAAGAPPPPPAEPAAGGWQQAAGGWQQEAPQQQWQQAAPQQQWQQAAPQQQWQQQQQQQAPPPAPVAVAAGSTGISIKLGGLQAGRGLAVGRMAGARRPAAALFAAPQAARAGSRAGVAPGAFGADDSDEE